MLYCVNRWRVKSVHFCRLSVIFQTSNLLMVHGRRLSGCLNEMAGCPCTLILSCSNRQPSDLVKQILGEEELPTPTPIVDTIKSYPWHIETKYYSADIALCTIDEKSIGNLEFAESVQAVVIHFDDKQKSCYSKIEEWLTFIKEYAPEVQLLVCDKCSDDASKHKALEWCLKYNFELVELDPSDDVEEDEDDDFPETTGIKRIIQALHAHLWPNMVIKSEPSFSATRLNSLLNSSALRCSDTLTESQDICIQPLVGDLAASFDNLTTSDSLPDSDAQNNASNLCEKPKNVEGDAARVQEDQDTQASEGVSKEHFLQAMGGDNYSGNQNFDVLFEQFQQMKDKAANLPFEERKKYAEEVAVAFWRAIGGDEEEIEGLDQD